MKKLLVLIVIIMLALTGCKTYTASQKQFASEYHITRDNAFVYVTASEALEILETGTGIVYFGFPECPWCQSAIKIFNEALNERNIKKVYYCNIKNDRTNNTEDYQKLVNLLSTYLYKDNEGQSKIYVPDLYFVKDGVIKYHTNELSTNSGNVEDYLTDEVKKSLKDDYIKGISQIYSASCTNCNE